MVHHSAKMKLIRAWFLGYLVGVVVYFGHSYSNSTDRNESSTDTNSYIVFDKIYSNLYKYVSSHVRAGKPLVETDMFGELETVRSNYRADDEGKVLSPFQDDYFQILDLIPSIKTVYLNIKQGALNEFLPDRFYNPWSNECSMLTAGVLSSDDGRIECIDSAKYTYWSMRDTPGSEGMHHIDYKQGLFKPLVYDHESVSKVDITNGTGNMGREDEIVTPWYVHVIKNAVISMRGEVFTSDKKWKIIPLVKDTTSLHFHFPTRTDPIIHNEVYVLTQFSKGEFTFSWLIECLPRIMRYLRFLQKHPSILIHVPSKSKLMMELLKDLGISEERVVRGTIRAKVTYLPTSTHYGRGNVVNTNLLSAYMRALMSSSVRQDTIVFLLSHESFTKPWLEHQNKLLTVLTSVAKRYNLRLELLADDTTTTIKAKKAMFQRAALVVGPHGEGFSNLVFSQPGTCVVEALCYKKWERRYGLRYQHLSHLLGHIYHGLLTPFECCMQMKPRLIEYYVRQCLEYRKQLGK